MITGDDGSHFITGGVSAGGFLGATSRRDDELVAGENEFGWKSTTRFRQRIVQHFRTPFFFRCYHTFGCENVNDVPFLRRSDDRSQVALPHVDVEESRAP